MSKECKGPYHGDGIKFIDDDEEYCLICQQEINRKKKANKEKAGGVIGILAVVFAVLKFLEFLGGGKSGGNNRA